jgi:hypothetical protein
VKYRRAATGRKPPGWRKQQRASYDDAGIILANPVPTSFEDVPMFDFVDDRPQLPPGRVPDDATSAEPGENGVPGVIGPGGA